MLLNFLQDKLPFQLDLLPKNSYLVGGSVRDALLKREKKYLDLDFILVKDTIQFAKKIAHQYQAGFVILDEVRKIARVVFPSLTIDFAQQEGETLIQDLHRRDYTINAIAYNLDQDELIDPLNGIKDLEKGIIRMISRDNLKDDPLRLLRAYRQACQLNFTIEDQTRSTINKLAPLLKNISPERINSELGYLLTNSAGSYWLKQAYQDGLLSVFLENITEEKVEYLQKIDEANSFLNQNWQQFQQKSNDWYYLAKLALLISTKPEIAEQELIKLKYSRAEIRQVITILKYLPKLLNKTTLMSLREQYFFFLEIGDIFPLIAISAVTFNVDQNIISTLINRYLDINDKVAHPQPLLTGNDLINNLGLSPSPKIGELLTEINIAQIEGKINNIDSALIFAKSLFER